MKISLSKLGIILSAITILSFAGSTSAASLGINTDKDTYVVGDQFNADVKITSQDVGINAGQATIKFSPAVLQVVSIDKTNSVFSFWIQDPAFDNNAGQITFIGGASSGLLGGSLQAIRVVFRAAGVGQSDLVFSDGAVTASDGSGTNVLTVMNKGSITVAATAAAAKATQNTTGKVQTINRTPVVANTSPAKPNVSVPLYPDPTAWYNTSSKFYASWKLPSDISAVATDLDKDPTFNPTSSQGIFDNETFSALSDGVWYLNVRFYNNVGWSVTNHYRIAVDTVLPAPFKISLSGGLSSDNPTPVATYQTNDQLSGIDHYYIQIDKNNIINTSSKSYTLPPQAPGKHTIRVGAQDRAGNSTEDTAQFEILPIQAPIITSVSSNIYSGEGGLVVNGQSLPNISIVVAVKGTKGNLVYSFSTIATGDGKWGAKFDTPLKNGAYYVEVTAKDSRGALSLPVKSGTINVVDRPVMVIWGLSITASQMIVLLILLLVGGYIIGWYSGKLLRGKQARRILISQRDVSASFNVIKTDIEKAIKSWDDGKIESHELTEMEFLLKRVNENIDKLQKYIVSGIKDIGRR